MMPLVRAIAAIAGRRQGMLQAVLSDDLDAAPSSMHDESAGGQLPLPWHGVRAIRGLSGAAWLRPGADRRRGGAARSIAGAT